MIHRTEANWFDLDHHVKIHVLCEEVGVPADRIVYLNNDIKTEERYDETIPDSNFGLMSICRLPLNGTS